MIRKEITGKRDLTFSSWIRNNLPDTKTGFICSDLDFILMNYKTKKLLLLEIKTRNAELRYSQKCMFKDIDKWIKNGIDPEWKYYGFHVIRFENTDFTDGKVYYDNIVVNETELIKILSLLD